MAKHPEKKHQPRVISIQIENWPFYRVNGARFNDENEQLKPETLYKDYHFFICVCVYLVDRTHFASIINWTFPTLCANAIYDVINKKYCFDGCMSAFMNLKKEIRLKSITF